MAKEKADKTESAADDYRKLVPLFELADNQHRLYGMVVECREVLEQVLNYRQEIAALVKDRDAVAKETATERELRDKVRESHEKAKAECAAEIASLQAIRHDEAVALRQAQASRAEEDRVARVAMRKEHATLMDQLRATREKLTQENAQLASQKADLEKGLDALVASATRR